MVISPFISKSSKHTSGRTFDLDVAILKINEQGHPKEGMLN